MLELKIPYKPRDYQKAVHTDPHRFKILVWHRQSGKTTLAINELVKKMVEEPGVYLYIGPDKAQAKNIIWKDPDVLFKYLPKELIKRTNEVELTVYLKNKSVFYIEGAATGEQRQRLRGIKPKGVIFDEFAQMDAEVWNTVVFPSINQRPDSWAIFIGTFMGKNHFYEMFTKYWDWSLSKYIFDDHYFADWFPFWKNPYFSPEQESLARKQMLPGSFNQEYGCLPLEGSSSVFGSLKELMTGALDLPNPRHFYSMGVDLAKYQDYTAISIIDRNTHALVYQDRFQSEWTTTLEKLIAVRNKYNKAHVTIDSTGVGDPIAELLAKRGVKTDDFKFSNTTKDQLVRKMGVYFDGKKITLPPIDQIPNLINELEQFTYVLLESGKIKYSAPSNLHDDEVMSLGLAMWYLKDNPITELYAVTAPTSTIPNMDPFQSQINSHRTPILDPY